MGANGLVRLSRDGDMDLGLAIAEDVEAPVSIIQARWPTVWACGCATNIRKYPVLAGIDSLTIFADAGENGAGSVASVKRVVARRGAR